MKTLTKGALELNSISHTWKKTRAERKIKQYKKDKGTKDYKNKRQKRKVACETTGELQNILLL